MSEIIWRTFQTWSNSGFLIIKGSKATKINGYNQFNQTQVKPKPVNPVVATGRHIGFDDQYWDNGCYGGDPMDYGNS